MTDSGRSTANECSHFLCSVCDAHSAIAMENLSAAQCLICKPLLAFLAIPRRLSLCDCLWTAGTFYNGERDIAYGPYNADISR